MKSRREFIKDIGKGLVAASVLSETGIYAQENFKNKGKQTIRVGIAGRAHTIPLAKMFNVEKKYPGVEVLYVWSESDEFVKRAAKEGAIPNIVKDPMEMMGKIDALIVDHQHPKYHLDTALPFIKAGIPTFIDKPFCYSTAKGKEFLKIARELKTPVTSYSTMAHNYSTMDMKEQVDEMDDVLQIISYGPSSVDSKLGGVFFYGVHTVQPLMYILGEDIVKVKVTKSGINTTAGLVFKSGYYATIIFVHRSTRMYKFETFVLRKNHGLVKLVPRIEEGNPPSKPYDDMVEMFRTGKEPRSHESIIKCVAVLEALDKSVNSQQWEKVVV